METIRTIFYVIVMLSVVIFALGIFIQANKELWEEVGKDAFAAFKDWFKSTSFGMWYNNKKNNVEILSDKEYENLLNKGKIFPIIVE